MATNVSEKQSPVAALQATKAYEHLDLKTPELDPSGKPFQYLVLGLDGNKQIYSTKSARGSGSLFSAGNTKWYMVDAAHRYEGVAGVSEAVILEWFANINGGQYILSAGEGTSDAMGTIPGGTTGLRHRFPDKEGRVATGGNPFRALSTVATEAAKYMKDHEQKLDADHFEAVMRTLTAACKNANIQPRQFLSALNKDWPELFARKEEKAQQ